VTLGISQTFYKYVHHRHHLGNSDRPDEHGNTYDWISIYRHGRDGKAENPSPYIFLSYLREDPKTIYREIKRKNRVDARWGIAEIAILGTTIAIGFLLNWKLWFFFLPFYYLGQCCTYLNGFFSIMEATLISRLRGESVRTRNGTICFGLITGITLSIISGRKCTG
jgi:hypothetical protein